MNTTTTNNNHKVNCCTIYPPLTVMAFFLLSLEINFAKLLTVYGGGEWPHLYSYERDEVHDNGNYYETQEISVRHGICGDPEQVSP